MAARPNLVQQVQHGAAQNRRTRCCSGGDGGGGGSTSSTGGSSIRSSSGSSGGGHRCRLPSAGESSGETRQYSRQRTWHRLHRAADGVAHECVALAQTRQRQQAQLGVHSSARVALDARKALPIHGARAGGWPCVRACAASQQPTHEQKAKNDGNSCGRSWCACVYVVCGWEIACTKLLLRLQSS